MKSPPVSVGSLRGIGVESRGGRPADAPGRPRGRARARASYRAGEYARCTMSATTQLVDAGPARRSLREQIARLEGELARTLASTYPRITAEGPPIAHRGPKLLDLGQLELTRDAL